MSTAAQFIRAWRVLRAQAAVEMDSSWTAADADALRGFLQGAHGQKLVGSLRRLVFSDQAAAVATSPERLPWACGHAAGMQSLAAHIDLLARWTGQAPERPSGPTDDLTWLHGNDPNQRSPEG